MARSGGAVLYRVVTVVDLTLTGAGTADDAGAFASFVADVEPNLRRALVAAYGADLGREAAADALAWAWQHRDRLPAMANPAGYLWRVGQTSVRRSSRARRREVSGSISDTAATSGDVTFEPALDPALAALSPQQRAAVLLVHGWGCSLSEAGTALGCSASTIRNHVARALRHLRSALEVHDV